MSFIFFTQALGNAALSNVSKGSNLNQFAADRGTEDQPVHVIMNQPKGLLYIHLLLLLNFLYFTCQLLSPSLKKKSNHLSFSVSLA